VNSKVYQETIEDVTMTAVGFDAGVIMKVGGTFIGATYNDINNTNHEWSNGTVDHLKAKCFISSFSNTTIWICFLCCLRS